MKTLRILGVDPGSRLTGYGIVDVSGREFRSVAHGTLRLSSTGGKSVVSLEARLLAIYQGLTEVIQVYKPEAMAVERVFFAKNALSALKLGQARGAVMLTGAIHKLDVFEYSPTEVKSAIVGHGRADKDQVARMLRLLLKIQNEAFKTADASDALALALCHAQLSAGSTEGSSLLRDKSQSRSRRGRRLSEVLGLE